MLVVLVIASAVQLASTMPAHAFEPAAESDFLARINSLRASVGVGPLAMDANNLYWGGTQGGAQRLWTLGQNAESQPVGSLIWSEGCSAKRRLITST